MSDNWYVVDTNGDTIGPMDEPTLIDMYLHEEIHSKTYIWNGLTVTKWLPIMHVTDIYNKIKDEYIHRYTLSNDFQPDPSSSVVLKNEKQIQVRNQQEEQNRIDDDQSIPEIPTESEEQEQEQEEEEEEEAEIEGEEQEEEEEEEEKMEIMRNMKKKEIEEIKQNIKQKEEKDRNYAKFVEYPPTLRFLKEDSFRTNLMQNIRNGILLRDSKTAKLKQNKTKLPPKRLKDEFKSNHKNKSIDRNSSENQKCSANLNDSLSLSTSIDQKLNIKQTVYHQPNKHKNEKMQYFIPDPSASSIASAQFSNEVAARASMIRQRFGQVEVVSGNKDLHSTRFKRNNLSTTQKLTTRIEIIKDKLDTLRENDASIIYKIEQILFSNNI